MTRFLLASLAALSVLLVGCKSSDSGTTADSSQAPIKPGTTVPGGKAGTELGTAEPTPTMPASEADKRVGSALGGK